MFHRTGLLPEMRVGLFLGVVCLLLGGTQADAQGAKTLPIADEFNEARIDALDEEDKKGRADLKRAIQAAQKNYRDFAFTSMQGKSDYRTQRAAFDKWFLEYEIPRLTLDSDEELRGLAQKRIDLLENYLAKPANVSGNAGLKRAAAEHLVRDLLFPSLSGIVTDGDPTSYAKQVKINAMLAIGELNLAEGTRSTAPAPLPDALPFMLSALKGTSVPDYLKAPALAGVERHALIDAKKSNASDANRADIKSVCLALLGDKPEGRSDDLQYWMQRRAAVILGEYADPGAANANATALVAILSNKDNRLWLRCEAAKAIGNMKFNPADAATLTGPATEVGKLAMNALRKEASFLRGEMIFLAEMELKRKATEASKTTSPGSRTMGPGEEGPSDDEMMMMMSQMDEGMSEDMGGLSEMMGPFSGAAEEDPKGEPQVSEFGNKVDPEKELPGYKINISRRRLKTVAVYLESAVGAKDDKGLARFLSAGGGQELLVSLRSAIEDVQKTAHMGVDDRYEALTLDMIDTMIANSEKIAKTLGVVDEVAPEDAAVEEMAKKAEEAIDKGVVKGTGSAAEGEAGDASKAVDAVKEATTADPFKE